MTCGSRRDVDIAAFLVEPTAAEWADFRMHYPGCRECSAEMARWAGLEGALRSVTEPDHPVEETLLAYRRAPESLSPAQRDELAAHLEACAPCRDALGAVVAIDLKQLLAEGEPAAAPDLSRPGLWQGLLEGVRGLFELPAPALAAAALAVLLLALGLPYLFQGGGELSGERPPPIARQEEPAPQQPVERLALEEKPAVEVQPEPETPAPAAEPAPEVVAQSEPPQPPPEPAPEVVAQPQPPPAPPEPAPAPPAPKASPAPKPDTWVVASLGPEPLLYSAPAGLPGGRIGGSARAGGGAGPQVVALVPETVGLTLESRPTLYWYLSAPSSKALQVRLNDVDAMKSLLSTTVKAPVAAGIHALRLRDHGVRLAPGRNYEWVVSVPGSDGEGSGGILRRVAPDAALETSLGQAEPAERVRLLARSGIWYDALDILSRSIAAQADDAGLRRGRAELLDQAGLAAPAAFDRSR